MSLKIVHEASSQRQHVRLRVPITVTIGDDTYEATDWSVAGLGAGPFAIVPAVGQIVPLTLIFKFEGFAFELAVKGEVKQANPETKFAGFAFVDVAPNSLSLLQYLIGAQLSGEMVTSGDVLAIIKRENFTGARLQAKEDAGQKKSIMPTVQRLVLLAILWSIGLGLVGYIGYSAFARGFVVRADGVLASPDAQMLRAPKAGTVLSVDAKPGERVLPNQNLSSLEAIDTSVVNIASNCDCIMGEILAAPGAFIARGAPIAQIVPTSGRIGGEFIVPLEAARRIRPGDHVVADIYVGDRYYNGRVERVVLPTFGETNAYARVSQGVIQLSAVVRVNFDRKLPASMVGQPASVRVSTLRLLNQDKK
ncbi:type IV pilus assembly PilZ [Asticcacaulis biprosthecium C19]|uniref:Type IV pilus assembly PilZ n=1 Tax=Asticcacaulis biprosthecium C19 TaxID=715226 RepID=F4QTL3_9CAUL|nr:HlyD family efflux transporter periplasmic adaptor subunit [Asticcacaulis biprosthecium]EGF90083.1 type IV pilus assembly PilZ [Asticcacaulis biprosthecium C19]